MTFDGERHRRRSLRLRGYDYARAGVYFVTVCTWGREPILGEVVGDGSCPNGVGTSVWRTWEGLPVRFPGIALDAFVVMPNHVHGIVFLGAVPDGEDRGLEEGRASPAPSPNAASALLSPGPATPPDAATRPGLATGVGAGLALPASPTASAACSTLGAVVGAFKSLSAIDGNRLLGRAGRPFWQRNYYEHVVRDDRALDQIRRYIAANPVHWAMDAENPLREAWGR